MKKINITTSKTVSYIFHLLSVARINYDNSYSIDYKDTVKSDDLSFLNENKQLLTFANGNAGLLVGLFIFYPCYMDFKGFEEFKKYYLNLKNSIVYNNVELLYSNYEADFMELKKWGGNDLFQNIQSEIQKINLGYKEQSLKLINIFIDNYNEFEKIWNIEQDKMANKMKVISEKLEKLDLIAKWEELTKLDFKTNKYDIIFCSSIENGPQANSLGYDKNVFYYNYDTEWMIHFISHEIGTHIFIELIASLFNPNEHTNNINNEPSLLYSAYESLAKFYNKQIFKDDYNYNVYDNDEQLQLIYDELLQRNPNITPKEMIVNAIKKL